MESVCLEKYSAPDFTELVWDLENYPSMTKESIQVHGQYCKSGTAVQKQTMKDFNGLQRPSIPTVDDPEARIAMCITLDEKVGITSSKRITARGDLTSLPYRCTPDGETYCLYKKNGVTYFKLLCECGLKEEEDGTAIGYCPVPGPDLLRN